MSAEHHETARIQQPPEESSSRLDIVSGYGAARHEKIMVLLYGQNSVEVLQELRAWTTFTELVRDQPVSSVVALVATLTAKTERASNEWHFAETA